MLLPGQRGTIDIMFAVSATTTQFASALTARPRNARHCRRTAGVVVNAASSEGEDKAVVFTAEQLNAERFGVVVNLQHPVSDADGAGAEPPLPPPPPASPSSP